MIGIYCITYLAKKGDDPNCGGTEPFLGTPVRQPNPKSVCKGNQLLGALPPFPSSSSGASVGAATSAILADVCFRVRRPWLE